GDGSRLEIEKKHQLAGSTAKVTRPEAGDPLRGPPARGGGLQSLSDQKHQLVGSTAKVTRPESGDPLRGPPARGGGLQSLSDRKKTSALLVRQPKCRSLRSHGLWPGSRIGRFRGQVMSGHAPIVAKHQASLPRAQWHRVNLCRPVILPDLA